MRTPALYREIEMVLEATVIGAIKIGVDSIAESIIPKYALHNSKIRTLPMMKCYCSKWTRAWGSRCTTFKSTRQKIFVGKSGWHFSTKQT